MHWSDKAQSLLVIDRRETNSLEIEWKSLIGLCPAEKIWSNDWLLIWLEIYYWNWTIAGRQDDDTSGRRYIKTTVRQGNGTSGRRYVRTIVLQDDGTSERQYVRTKVRLGIFTRSEIKLFNWKFSVLHYPKLLHQDKYQHI